ncbi:MAG: replication initiator protein A [Thermodesulfobacteriota bacterium]
MKIMKTQKNGPNVCLGLDELNLAEYPIALLTDKKTISFVKKTIEIIETGLDEKGNQVERKWVVTGTDKYGLPVSPDDEVFMCLLEITKEKTNFENRNVPISAYEIIKRMGWREEGKSYQRVKESLARLKGVSIIAENVFWNNKSKSYSTTGFGIIDDYKIENPKKKRPGDNSEQGSFSFFSYIAWNQRLFHSFQNGNLKYIDLTLWRSWRHSITKRLHRYLDKHFYWKNSISLAV